jgi:hypothetical protein
LASNTANQSTILTNLQTAITNFESVASNFRCGDNNIDSVSRMLLTTDLRPMFACLFDNGSRAQATAVAQARSANNNSGAGLSGLDPNYLLLDNFMKQLAAQIAVLAAPTSVGRRVHTAGQ